ncbi:hypothetical protein M1615_01060 [Patescibacteria group bacterium]|nr:hypothetical protein [Patescibacteria group bacterium]MCL5010467.1 hypothetical protein [Patescibacteria group bacterium]
MSYLETKPRITGKKPKDTQTSAVSEAPGETRRFSESAREYLLSEGYLIYELTGQSIEDLRKKESLEINQHLDLSVANFEKLSSMRSEVAINPNNFLMQVSNNKTLPEQEIMIKAFSEKLKTEVRDVEAVMGQVPDYAELWFKYKRETGGCLLGQRFGRTKTPSGIYSNADVGADHRGFVISFSNTNDSSEDLYAGVLLVPAA